MQRTPEIEKQADVADLAIVRAAEAMSRLEEMLLKAGFPYADRGKLMQAEREIYGARTAVRAWMDPKRKQETAA